ncbi:MAG: CCA tRNA nucleotidyltransferase [uncultured Corynebacteriales bacterium]|uniref:CCA tRNA nucleotidyltransferase n=1 Tax=uncultured Mycobacteriales bacterium TaxID=581187 RepID=A0A6J4JCG4_9ACTN|nr:MAG: CCA tRNA nucleotidyltransferase [uncultured Corynebacteriales bacterium]
MTSPADLVRVPEVADRLGALFAAAGHELHLVGGTVRDALLGRPADDLDFATDARPEAVLELVTPLGTTWTAGIDFGTVGVLTHGMRCEITTYRADRYDRISRNPLVAYGDSLDDDLRRRDFTMNAMALSVPGHVFADPYGGLRDLAGGALRTPADPLESFADDPLRMLRAARFVAQLGVTPTADTVAAMVTLTPEIGRITAERVQVEFSKLLTGAHPRRGLELLVDTGLADVIVPELPALRMEIDEHHQHKDVYVHSLTVLEQAVALEEDGPDLVLRLAALLHDIGKPATRRHEPGGGVSFHHHEVVGAKLVRARLKALKYPKEIVEDVSRLTLLHLRFHGYGRGEWTDSAVRRYVTDAGPLVSRLHKLVRSDCTTRNRRRAAALARTYDLLEERIARISAEEDLRAVRPDLDGNEIMRLLGLPPGPLVGQAWRHLKELRLDRGPLDHDEAIAELRRWAAERDLPAPGSG